MGKLRGLLKIAGYDWGNTFKKLALLHGNMKKKILIVEDNDLNLKLFRDLLGAHGYDTIETKEGLEAITLTKSERPDLILMDIQLPEISGLDVTRRLKADPSICHIPIVAVTAFAMKDDEEKILAAGCEAYLSKPISIMTFMETVKRFLGEEAMA